MRIKKYLIVFVAVFAGATYAGILDDTGDLKGKLVLAAGDLERLDCPLYGDYDCDSWPRNLLRFKHENVCITSQVMACGRFCTGILAADQSGSYFFEFERLGSGLKKYPAQRVSCPNIY